MVFSYFFGLLSYRSLIIATPLLLTCYFSLLLFLLLPTPGCNIFYSRRGAPCNCLLVPCNILFLIFLLRLIWFSSKKRFISLISCSTEVSCTLFVIHISASVVVWHLVLNNSFLLEHDAITSVYINTYIRTMKCKAIV